MTWKSKFLALIALATAAWLAMDGASGAGRAPRATRAPVVCAGTEHNPCRPDVRMGYATRELFTVLANDFL